MAETQDVVFINGKNYPLVRRKLKDWLAVESIKSNLSRAAQAGDVSELSNLLISYVCAAFHLEQDEVAQAEWYDVTIAFLLDQATNFPTKKFAIIRSKFREVHNVWDYDGREWFLWVHILAAKYGWSIEYIAELDIDQAIALLQEIQIEDQLEKEWEWGTTELAYDFDEASKKSKLRPLPRPDWMTPEPTRNQPKTVRMPLSLRPVGLVMTWAKDDKPND